MNLAANSDLFAFKDKTNPNSLGRVSRHVRTKV